MSASVEKLKAARELIARPGGWMQGAFCLNPDGTRPTSESRMSEKAVCFCAEGAIVAAGGSRWGVKDEGSFLRAVVGWIPEWNDAPGRTQAEVVAAFDRAIALAEAEAS